MLTRFAVMAALFSAGAAAASDVQHVGAFAAALGREIPAPWRVVQFDRNVPATAYRLRDWDGVAAVEARAESSMALLARPIEVDLERTPILCWRWRIEAPLRQADLARRSSDDFAARVYVAFRLPDDELTLSTRVQLRLARSLYGELVPDAALNYVWDNRYPVGTQRPNAYTDRAQMVVLRSGGSLAGRWVGERRNVRSDLLAAFGTTRGSALMLAVATNTDNTGESALAGYADLKFVSAEHGCP